jgi:hypothetical protein
MREIIPTRLKGPSIQALSGMALIHTSCHQHHRERPSSTAKKHSVEFKISPEENISRWSGNVAQSTSLAF